MKKKKMIAALGGSLREPSYSLAGLKAALQIAESLGAETELLDVRQLDLPMFVPDLPIEGYPVATQASLTRLIDVYRRADGMVWASPTYHGTVSGSFKNAIDFMEFLSDGLQREIISNPALGRLV